MVTDNGSRSYTFSAAKATENARFLLFDEEFTVEAAAAGYGPELFAESPETVDVVTGCPALVCVVSELCNAFKLVNGKGTESEMD